MIVKYIIYQNIFDPGEDDTIVLNSQSSIFISKYRKITTIKPEIKVITQTFV